MTTLLVILVVGLLIGAVLFKFLFGDMLAANKETSNYRYAKQAHLLSAGERAFYDALVSVAGTQYGVVFKVRVADVLTPKSTGDRSSWQSAFNRISAKHFDFVLIDKASLQPIAAIELDDKSHQTKKAKAADEVKNQACESAGFTLIRVRAKRRYNLIELRDHLKQHVDWPAAIDAVAEQVEESAAPVTEPLPAESATTIEQPSSELPSVKPSTPACPKCGDATKSRRVTRGKNAGKSFWVCRNFPECRGAIAKPQTIKV